MKQSLRTHEYQEWPNPPTTFCNKIFARPSPLQSRFISSHLSWHPQYAKQYTGVEYFVLKDGGGVDSESMKVRSPTLSHAHPPLRSLSCA